MNTLEHTAEQLGVRLLFSEPAGGRQAEYFPEVDVILIKPGLPLPLYREALAHELGHARYGHRCSDRKTEAQAWKYAVALLFGDGSGYRALELQGFDKHQIAEELEVTVRAVEMFQQQLLATDYGTYVAPRHGAGVYGARHANLRALELVGLSAFEAMEG